jgi:hypothetical protein
VKITFISISFCCLIILTNCERKISISESKAQNFLFIYLLGHPASKSPKKEKTHHDAELLAVEYLYRTTLKGDFDGDGSTDILYESMLSRVTGTQIDSLIYENFPGGFHDPYTGLVVALCDLKPSLKLKSPDGLPDLKLNHTDQVFGVLDIKNLGDLNEIPGDEFAVIVDWADWSNVNTCQIYSLINNEWDQLFDFEIRDGFSDGDYRFSLINEVLEFRDHKWYYYETDATADSNYWQKLNL